MNLRIENKTGMMTASVMITVFAILASWAVELLATELFLLG